MDSHWMSPRDRNDHSRFSRCNDYGRDPGKNGTVYGKNNCGEVKKCGDPVNRNDSFSSNGTKVLGSPKKRYTKSQNQAKEYLKEKNIYDLFHFLMGHLLVEEPEDPIQYLADLLDKCINFKLGVTSAKPPLLFTSRHIESMYRSFDPAGVGCITVDQYKIGLKTLGIQNFNPCPKEAVPGKVEKCVFMNEAKRGLLLKLAKLTGRANINSIVIDDI